MVDGIYHKFDGGKGREEIGDWRNFHLDVFQYFLRTYIVAIENTYFPKVHLLIDAIIASLNVWQYQEFVNDKQRIKL